VGNFGAFFGQFSEFFEVVWCQNDRRIVFLHRKAIKNGWFVSVNGWQWHLRVGGGSGSGNGSGFAGLGGAGYDAGEPF
jgi:hypothetical protein